MAKADKQSLRRTTLGGCWGFCGFFLEIFILCKTVLLQSELYMQKSKRCRDIPRRHTKKA